MITNKISTFSELEALMEQMNALRCDMIPTFNKSFPRELKQLEQHSMTNDNFMGLSIEKTVGTISHKIFYFGRQKNKNIGKILVAKIYNNDGILYTGFIPDSASDVGRAAIPICRASSKEFFEQVRILAKMAF